MLARFFFNLSKRELFIDGARYDRYVMFVFGPLLWLLPIIQNYIPYIWTVLLLDQVSRHIYRGNSERIAYYTKQLQPYILNLTHRDLDMIDITQLAFISLATRHLLRILSQEKISSKHAEISQKMLFLIELMDKRLELYQTEISLAIHSQNKLAYRRYRYISTSYQCWDVAPPRIDLAYFEQFLETEIAQYTIKTIERLIDINSPARFYIMCSGGIDSMTLLRIFNGLRLTNYFTNFSYRVLHIDWHYRNESTIEKNELEKIFKSWNMHYMIVDSPIDPNDPDWNRKSTDFRFELLKKITKDGQIPTYFCLGHIITDVIENLICNVCLEGSSTGKQTYFNLFGMEEMGKTSNIDPIPMYLFRPLLLHKKPDVMNSTPFLKDNATTVDIKRRIVRRLLKEFEFDESRIRTVYEEAQELRQKYRLTDIHTPFKYDPHWTTAEWREIFNNFGGVKKKFIQRFIQQLKTSSTFTANCGDKTFKVNENTTIELLE